MHSLDYFQRIYVINLPERLDRREEMSAQLASLGLELGKGGVELYAAQRPEAKGDFPSIGSRGCFLSHLGILRSAAESGYSRILILEDDLNFVPDFAARIGPIVRNLEAEGWSHFYGGYTISERIVPSQGTEIAFASAETPVQCTHFVAFNGSVIQKLVSYLEDMLRRPAGDPQGGPMHVDGAYTWYRRHNPEERTFIASPELGYQRSSRTDVHQLRWYDRVPVVQGCAAMLRQYKNRKR